MSRPAEPALPYQITHNRLPAGIEARLTACIQANIRRGVFPAAALTVIYRGATQFSAAYGWQNPITQQPLQLDDRFDLASITKLFTTTAFLALVSAGIVQLETPLVTILPEFGRLAPRAINGGQDPHSKQLLPVDPAFAGQTVDPARVTCWHLLTHTSGLPPWRAVYNVAGPAPTPPTQPDPIPQAERWQRALAALVRYPFVGQPGTTVRYSDIGLLLLGEATSRLWQQWQGTTETIMVDTPITQLVLHPLGLTTIGFNPVRTGGWPLERCVPTEEDPHWRQRRAWGEVHDENACGVGGVAGHAGLFAPVEALALFGQTWLEAPQRLGVAPELAADAQREHAATDGMRRGLGFALKAHSGAMVGERLSARTFGHSGFTGTTLWIDPEHQLVVALLTNAVYPGRGKDGIFEFRQAVHTILADAWW